MTEEPRDEQSSLESYPITKLLFARFNTKNCLKREEIEMEVVIIPQVVFFMSYPRVNVLNALIVKHLF